MIGSTDLHHHFHRSCSKFPPLKAEHKPTFFAYNMDLNLIGSLCKASAEIILGVGGWVVNRVWSLQILVAFSP